MKKTGIIMAMAMVLGLVVCGIGFAGDEPAPGMDILQQDSIELTGTVLSDNTFVDENGENYKVLESEASQDLQEHIGERIKVTATVMESEDGPKNLVISSYEFVEE